jgi:uncharacterized protein YkwD
MVNKALLGIAAVVLLVVFGLGLGVGILVGGSGGGGAADASPQTDDASGSSDSTGTTTPTASDSTGTATPTASDSTGTATPGTADDEPKTVPLYRFNKQNISEAVVENINAVREEEGLQPLASTGTTAENVRQMATSHSEAMADAGRVKHSINGVTSSDRYKRDGLYNTCRFQVESYVENADKNELEVIGRTYAGQEYPDGDTKALNRNDTAVANALTEDWLSTSTSRDRLLQANADHIGVGITVTTTRNVYATVNIC